MAEVFKCCKKPNNWNNWICIVCCNVFHPSCIKRTKYYESLNSNFIYCSVTCRDIALRTNEGEDQSKSSLCLVQDLQAELEQKNNYITRLKRNSTVFEEDASEMESRFRRDIEVYQQEISDLQLQLKQKIAIIESYENKTFANGVTQTTLKMNTIATQTLVLTAMQSTQSDNVAICSSGTQTSINLYQEAIVQTDDSEVPNMSLAEELQLNQIPNYKGVSKNVAVQTRVTSLATKIKKSRIPSGAKDFKINQPDHQFQPISGPQQLTSVRTTQPGKTRLFMMGSQCSVRNVPYLLKHNSYSKLCIDINCQYSIQPITLSKMAFQSKLLCKHFSKNDYVLFFIDSRSTAERETLRLNNLQEIFNTFSHTNLIIVAASHTEVSKRQRQDVYEYNILINKIVHSSTSNVVFIPIDPFLEETKISMDYKAIIYKAKQRLASFIFMEHLIKKPVKLTGNNDTPLEERLQKLLGKKDIWHPKISTFPINFPNPSNALREMDFPNIHYLSPAQGRTVNRLGGPSPIIVSQHSNGSNSTAMEDEGMHGNTTEEAMSCHNLSGSSTTEVFNISDNSFLG